MGKAWHAGAITMPGSCVGQCGGALVSDAWSMGGAPVSSGPPVGQGVVVGFSLKWRDTGEAADAGFDGGVPGSSDGSGGPCCWQRSPVGRC
jgi:hypothetical protein